MVSNPTASNRGTVNNSTANNRATVPPSMEVIHSKDTEADISRLLPRKVMALVPAEGRH